MYKMLNKMLRYEQYCTHYRNCLASYNTTSSIDFSLRLENIFEMCFSGLLFASHSTFQGFKRLGKELWCTLLGRQMSRGNLNARKTRSINLNYIANCFISAARAAPIISSSACQCVQYCFIWRGKRSVESHLCAFRASCFVAVRSVLFYLEYKAQLKSICFLKVYIPTWCFVAMRSGFFSIEWAELKSCPLLELTCSLKAELSVSFHCNNILISGMVTFTMADLFNSVFSYFSLISPLIKPVL